MKRLFAIVLTITMLAATALSFTGCKKTVDETTEAAETTEATEVKTVGVEEETTPATTEEIPTEDTEAAIEGTDTKPAPGGEDVTTTTEDDNTALYTVKVVDEAGNPVTTATLVQICDEVCVPVKLVDGVGEKKLEINENYHVQLTSGLPEGYEFTTEETDYYFDENNVCTIVLKAVA